MLTTTSTLMAASNQWASRPADERFTSLFDMQDHFHAQRRNSRSVVVSNRKFEAVPYTSNADGSQGEESHKALSIMSKDGHHYAPTNWAFGQLAQLAEAPEGSRALAHSRGIRHQGRRAGLCRSHAAP